MKTTEVGGIRGFDAFKRVKGRKRHILVDTLGLPIANLVGAADVSDRRAGALLASGLTAILPMVTTVIADAGHESRRLASALAERQGWQLQIAKRRQRALKITGFDLDGGTQFRLARTQSPCKTLITKHPPSGENDEPLDLTFIGYGNFTDEAGEAGLVL